MIDKNLSITTSGDVRHSISRQLHSDTTTYSVFPGIEFVFHGLTIHIDLDKTPHCFSCEKAIAK